MDIRRAGQVAHIALFGRHGQNLTAHFKDGPRPVGRERGVTDIAVGFFVMGSGLRQIGHNLDWHRLTDAGDRVEEVNAPSLFIDHHTAARRHRTHIKICVVCHLAHTLGLGVVGKDIHRVVAVREKVDRRAQPTGVGVAGVDMGDLFDFVAFTIKDPDGAGLAAPVALPGVEGFRNGGIGDPFAVRRISAPRRHRQGQSGRKATRARHSEKAGNPLGHGITRRAKEDLFAVGRPPLHPIVAGVEGQLGGRTAIDRNQINTVPGLQIAGGIGHPLSIGRKAGALFDAGMGGEPLRVAAIAVGDPEIAGIEKS